MKPKPTLAQRVAREEERIAALKARLAESSEPPLRAAKTKATKPPVERKEVKLREVPILQWENAYNDSWRDLIVPEAFAH